MKRFLLLLFVATSLVSLANAQQNQKNVALGFVASPTFNWMNISGKDVIDSKAGLGFDFGVTADFFMDNNNRYALKTGVLISGFNTTVSYQPEQNFNIGGESYLANTKLEVDYNLKYVQIPLALRLRTKQFHRTTFWGQFGLFTAFNVGAKASTNDDALRKSEIAKDINLLNMGMDVGIGAEYDLGEHNAIGLAVLYKGGFMNVIDKDTQLGDKTTTRSLAIQLSFIF